MHGSGGAAATPQNTARFRWLVIVVAIMALLTAGWPLINLVVSDNRRITANTRLTVGPSHRDSAQVTIGPGWLMQSAQSNPHEAYSLRRGGVTMSIAYVYLFDRDETGDLWSGMREVIRISHPGATISAPRPITSAHGFKGAAGAVTSPSMAGTAAVYAYPAREFAIEMVIIAPRRTPLANLVAAQRIVRSLLFLAAPR
jgi:hypothetical protein